MSPPCPSERAPYLPDSQLPLQHELPIVPIDESSQSEREFGYDPTVVPLAGNAGEDIGVGRVEHARMDERRPFAGREQRQDVLDDDVAQAALTDDIQVAKSLEMTLGRRRPRAQPITRKRPAAGE